MEDEERTAETERLTRKKVLKRAGVVGVAAWSAPLVFASSASAANPKARCIAATEANQCACSSSCVGLTALCSADGNCYCTIDVKGCCACINVFDGTFDCASTPCNKINDCPRGFTCVNAPCCANGAKGICVKNCTSPAGASSRAARVVKLGS
jgi:hypothetical protein